MAGKTMGTCAFCKLKHPIDEMVEHVVACERRPTGTAEAIQIVVRSPELPEFWMIVEAQPKATLDDLDEFLRDSWLECCGHLSQFKIGKTTYISSNADHEYGDEEPESMGEQINEVLKPRSKFSYEYDFGSTTELGLEVIGRIMTKPSKKPIRLLALNDPPQRACEECGKPATGLCAYCEAMPICKTCIKKHDCGDEAICPIVNSPRAGVCGYTGSAISI